MCSVHVEIYVASVFLSSCVFVCVVFSPHGFPLALHCFAAAAGEISVININLINEIKQPANNCVFL